MTDIIENSKSYSIFDDNKYTSDISSTLTTIIEENEEISARDKTIKNNMKNNIKKDNKQH